MTRKPFSLEERHRAQAFDAWSAPIGIPRTPLGPLPRWLVGGRLIGALVALMVAVGIVAIVLGWFPADRPWVR
jgi:hypothetical protein